MAGIDVKNFGGVIARGLPSQIPAEGPISAAYANNVLFDREGAITSIPVYGTFAYTYTGFSGVRTVFPYYFTAGSRGFMRWTTDVQVVMSPVAGDTQGRVYWAGADTAPGMTFQGEISVDGSFTYRPLGILAPSTKPTVSGTAYPPDTAAGAIEEVNCGNLIMIHECKGKEGRNSGLGENIINATTTPVSMETLRPGTRIKVATIVDVDHVTVTGIGGIDYACIVEKRDMGLKWAGGDSLWRKRKKAYWNFLIPSGVTLKITNHNLLVGDVIQVIATPTPMLWTFAQLTTNLDTTNQQRRLPVKNGGGAIVFTGSCNFIVERGDTTIDPLTPHSENTYEERIYVYTYVSDLGEEGPPSPASDLVLTKEGDPVTISGFVAPPADGRVITHRRIYRTNTGSQTSELQLVHEMVLATTSYTDTKTAEELAEVCPSETWEPPYTDLITLRALPNGALVGARGNTLCFSEPNYPHAWPPEYEYPLDYEITGVEVVGDTIVVGTRGNPYIFAGVHPRQMSNRKLEIHNACLGVRAMCSMGDAVAYACVDGIIRVAMNGSAEMITDYLLPRSAHTKFLDLGASPGETIMGEGAKLWFYDRTLYFYGAGAIPGGYAIRFGEDNQMHLTYTAQGDKLGAILDPRDGLMYYAVRLTAGPGSDSAVGYAVAPNRSTTAPGTESATWVSRVFTFERPVNLLYGRVYFERVNEELMTLDPKLSGNHVQLAVDYLSPDNFSMEFVAINVHDGATEGLPGDKVFTLDTGVKSDRVQFTLTITGPELYVARVRLGETIDDVVDQGGG